MCPPPPRNIIVLFSLSIQTSMNALKVHRDALKCATTCRARSSAAVTPVSDLIVTAGPAPVSYVMASLVPRMPPPLRKETGRGGGGGGWHLVHC